MLGDTPTPAASDGPRALPSILVVDDEPAILTAISRQLRGRFAVITARSGEEGLDKLAKHPDVLGVCLDNQPLPEPPPVVYKHEVPHPEPGEFNDEPGVKAKKVDVRVYQALKQNDRVSVIFSLEPTGDSLPTSTHVPDEMHQRGRERRAAARKLQDRVLSTLRADDFWLSVRFMGAGLGGYVSREGVEKLCEHPEVSKFGLVGLKQHGWKKPSSPRSRRNR